MKEEAKNIPPASSTQVAYFSMEIGLEPKVPTYSGGLGVLAGDTLRSAADLSLPTVGITLLHRKGFFKQSIDEKGKQSEAPVSWRPEDFLEKLEPRVTIVVGGRDVQLQVWRYIIRGQSGFCVPVYLLDAALPENHEDDQTLTDHLYGGDNRYRLCQELILGVGGAKMLRTMGHDRLRTYHMNEGHAALLTLELVREHLRGAPVAAFDDAVREDVRQQCVFTTHTPVPAGHDKFPMSVARNILDEDLIKMLEKGKCCIDDTLNMTFLALYFSRFVNGVAMRHGQISSNMFPEYPIQSITNGVHAATWAAPSIRELFDRHLPEWRKDNMNLRYAVSFPLDEVQHAHAAAKRALLNEVEKRSKMKLSPQVLTIGYARRATPYKRAALLFQDIDRLKKIAKEAGAIQFIYAGKAHPKDEGGKEIIRKIYEAAERLKGSIPVVFLENYDMELGGLLCSGVDVWLNTPQKPQEASGTSGMKAALNGVPSLSILDGWWIEGHVEGVTGWSIGESWKTEPDRSQESESLYRKLEQVVVPLYYKEPQEYAQVMRMAIALNGSFFNTQRMLVQYIRNAYEYAPVTKTPAAV